MNTYEQFIAGHFRDEARQRLERGVPVVSVTVDEPWGSQSVYSYEKPLGMNEHDWRVLQLAMVDDIAEYYDSISRQAYLGVLTLLSVERGPTTTDVDVT